MKYYENLKTRWKHDLVVPGLSLRNKFLTIVVKDAQREIFSTKIFWSCLILLDFFTFGKYFVHGGKFY